MKVNYNENKPLKEKVEVVKEVKIQSEDEQEEEEPIKLFKKHKSSVPKREVKFQSKQSDSLNKHIMKNLQNSTLNSIQQAQIYNILGVKPRK